MTTVFQTAKTSSGLWTPRSTCKWADCRWQGPAGFAGSALSVLTGRKPALRGQPFPAWGARGSGARPASRPASSRRFEGGGELPAELGDGDDPAAYVTNLSYYHLAPFETDILD